MSIVWLGSARLAPWEKLTIDKAKEVIWLGNAFRGQECHSFLNQSSRRRCSLRCEWFQGKFCFQACIFLSGHIAFLFEKVCLLWHLGDPTHVETSRFYYKSWPTKTRLWLKMSLLWLLLGFAELTNVLAHTQNFPKTKTTGSSIHPHTK